MEEVTFAPVRDKSKHIAQYTFVCAFLSGRLPGLATTDR